MISTNPLAVWLDNKGTGIFSFQEMVQVYTAGRTVLLKAKATVAYPVHIVLLNSSRKYCQYLFNQCHTYVGFLLVSTFNQDPHSKIVDVTE